MRSKRHHAEIGRIKTLIREAAARDSEWLPRVSLFYAVLRAGFIQPEWAVRKYLTWHEGQTRYLTRRGLAPPARSPLAKQVHQGSRILVYEVIKDLARRGEIERRPGAVRRKTLDVKPRRKGDRMEKHPTPKPEPEPKPDNPDGTPPTEEPEPKKPGEEDEDDEKTPVPPAEEIEEPKTRGEALT